MMKPIETTQQTLQIQALPVTCLSRAAALIAESFREEGFTRNTHNLSTSAQQKRFAVAGELRLLFNHVGGQQLLAAIQMDMLAGVAVVKSPTAKSTPWYKLTGEILRRVPLLVKMLGDMRWRQILKIKPALQLPVALPTSYYTLDILAVSPDFQGKGIGRLLLEHIHSYCDQDEQAAGIYLYTGDEKNTDIYRRFGYTVVEAKQGGLLTVWHMFRPRPKS
jgi:GNAT superfamily N-acetyltransferase